MPPMPARVAAIKAAIETRQDFSVLAHGGEDAVAAWARTHGMNGRALICEWQQAYLRAHLSTGGRSKKTGNLNTNSYPGLPKRDIGMTSAGVVDLDYWSDTEPDEPDDDPDDDLIPCAACAGRGKDSAGNRCSACNGTGKVTPSDGDENEDETDDDEDQDE